jgi:RNA polymerase sigma-70 factor (ECF subfamily)
MVLRRCRAILRDDARAEDAMQDVFVRLLAHDGTLTSTGLSSLLYRMATQVSLNKLRGQRRRPEDADDDLLARIANSEDHEAASGARRLLVRLFGSEPESTQVMATLHLYDGLTLEEVARETGMSVSGVRKRLRGLRANLHELAAEAS